MSAQRLIILIFCMLVFEHGFPQGIPKAEISNGIVNAKLYLPDANKGYYRATRFDWSGLIPYLEYDGHTYFGQWFKNYDPFNHESVMGPVEEFEPVGYEKAKIGEHFLKIGVGTLIKPKEREYKSFNLYEVSNHGEWKLSKKPNQIIFEHILNSKNYAYEYKKNVSLTVGKPELVLSHKFTNTGKKTIETRVYNHNFFFIDNKNIAKGYSVKFPFNISVSGRLKGIDEYAKITKNEIIYTKELPIGKQVYIESITGYESNNQSYNLNIENTLTGAGVKIRGNRPLSNLKFWSINKTVCPEPYINIKAKPGETITWKISYSFYSI